VYNLSRMRESATKRYKVFHIPTDWMLDAGYVSQVHFSYVFRFALELEATRGLNPSWRGQSYSDPFN
jgi:hypothetical protein